jgi:hypothetical protein
MTSTKTPRFQIEELDERVTPSCWGGCFGGFHGGCGFRGFGHCGGGWGGCHGGWGGFGCRGWW